MSVYRTRSARRSGGGSSTAVPVSGFDAPPFDPAAWSGETIRDKARSWAASCGLRGHAVWAAVAAWRRYEETGCPHVFPTLAAAEERSCGCPRRAPHRVSAQREDVVARLLASAGEVAE